MPAPDDQAPRHAPGLPRAQSLERAVALVRAVGAQPRAASTAALARACGLPVATAARLLATLADAGWVERGAGDAGWVVGYDLVRLVRGADPHGALVARARPVMEALRARTEETVMLGVPRPGPQVDVVAQVDAPHLLGVTSWIGRPIPVHASAAGKLLLAELTEDELAAWEARERPRRFTPATLTEPAPLREELARVRAHGHAELAGELEPGLAALAVGVRDPDGALAALLGISGSSLRLTPERRAELVEPVREAGAELAGLLR